ncbi:MAG: GtrA family protein [Lachnospiraceae bacterium]
MKEKFIALIPVFEPSPVLIEILIQLRKLGMEIILVDDGSGAAFWEVFSRASSFAEIITHPVNRGKGAALKTGMEYIRINYSENCVIVTVDGDGQHRAEDAVRLCRMAVKYPEGLILGYRELKGNAPLKSRFGNMLTRWIFGCLTGVRLKDTQTGLRAFNAALIPLLLSIPGERYEYEMKVLLEFTRKKIPIQEMEIDTIYLDNNSASHFHLWRDSFLIYKEVLKFSAASFVGFLVDYVLYSLLIFTTSNLRIANVGARIISATVNYILNRRFVFRSTKSIFVSAIQYILLAAAILFFNTLLLEFLANTCQMNRMLAKLCSEAVFFFVSWLVQRGVIFKKENSLNN